MRTIVYVDGYNLYYGLLRQSNFKWLDLYTLFKNYILEPEAILIEVRYYTAPVLGRMSDNPLSTQRQRTYLQALRKTHPDRVFIIEGKIIMKMPFLRLKEPIPEAPSISHLQVIHFSEKKTDVNIAADMINDAWMGRYDQAVLCSNDSDLEAALLSIKTHHPSLRLGLAAPIEKLKHRYISKDLTKHTDWSTAIGTRYLKASQLPEKIPYTRIQKPSGW